MTIWVSPLCPQGGNPQMQKECGLRVDLQGVILGLPPGQLWSQKISQNCCTHQELSPKALSQQVCVRERQDRVSLPRSLTWKTEAGITSGLQASRFAKADGKCPGILDNPHIRPATMQEI